MYSKFVLRADTLAARTTGDPSALAQIIRQVYTGLPPERHGVNLPSAYQVFVEPPSAKKRFDRSADFSQWLVQARLENLDLIAAGRRQPFATVRDGQPVVGPKGWH